MKESGGGEGGGYNVTLDASAFLQNKFHMAMSPDPYFSLALGKGLATSWSVRLSNLQGTSYHEQLSTDSCNDNLGPVAELHQLIIQFL